MHLHTRNVNTAFQRLVRYFDGQRDRKREAPVVRKDSRNGPVLMIEEPVLVTYTHPRERVLFNKARDANPFFHLYEALWMLAGRNDVAPLAYYASNMANYSDDGKTLNGAYGYRWRHAAWESDEGYYVRSAVDQLDTLVAHLKADPTSRRAVLQMWNVEDDLLNIGPMNRIEGTPFSKDVCCNLSVMFSLRSQFRPCTTEELKQWGSFDGHQKAEDIVLDMTVTNRSNDMIWGMLGANYVHFTFLQEYVAARLGVEVGVYNHFTNNLHAYENNWKPEEWLASANVTEGYGDMKGGKFVPLVSNVETFEKELQSIVGNAHGKGVIGSVGMSNYFEPFLQTVAKPMFCAFALHKEREYSSALAWANRIPSDDWRVAANQWLLKREKNHDDAGRRQGKAGGS